MAWDYTVWKNLFFNLWTVGMQSVQKFIAMNIKLARTKRSISQIEVANKIGIEVSY